MKTKIIILTGKAQSGKDTVCSFISSYLADRDISAGTYSFATSLKKMCVDILGLDYKQCWGSNEQKDTLTKFRWSSLPLTQEEIEVLVRKNNKNINSLMTARDVMQVFGTNIFRRFYPDCWVQSTINRIKKDGLDFAIISDARFPNEINLLGLYSPLVIRLKRNVLANIHESETALDNYVFGSTGEYYEIDNCVLSIKETNTKIGAILGEYV